MPYEYHLKRLTDDTQPSITAEAWCDAVARIDDARIVTKRFSQLFNPRTGEPIQVPHGEHDVEILLPHLDFERRCAGDSQWIAALRFFEGRISFNAKAHEHHDEIRDIVHQLCEALGLHMYGDEGEQRDPLTGEMI